MCTSQDEPLAAGMSLGALPRTPAGQDFTGEILNAAYLRSLLSAWCEAVGREGQEQVTQELKIHPKAFSWDTDGSEVAMKLIYG